MTTSGVSRTRPGERATVPVSERPDEASSRGSGSRGSGSRGLGSRGFGSRGHRDAVPGLVLWWSRLVVAVIPIGAVALVVPRYRHSSYFYDEWSMLDRVASTHVLHGALEPFNGHLYLVPFLTYRAQLALGLDGHALVWTVFCTALLACNVAVALALWAARVPPLAAVVAGAAITYFGPGAQLMTLEFQFGMIGAIALSFLTAFIVLRSRPAVRPAVAIAVVLLLATAFDSGSATGGALFAGVLLALRWRDRWMFLALGPAALGLFAYLLVHGTAPTWPAPLGSEISVGVHLFLLAAGGLAGGGEITGAVVLVAAGALFAFAIARGRMSRDAAHCLVAGIAAALVMDGVIASTRAGIIKGDYLDFNRYTALIAFFLLFALLVPAISVARDLLPGHRGVISLASAAFLGLAFLGNLAPLDRYRALVEGWQTQAHTLVLQSSQQLTRGCPDGRPPKPDALPLGVLGPQVSVRLLEQLEARSGTFHPGAPIPVSAPVRNAMCSR